MFGACCMLLGVILLMWGRNLAYSLGGSLRYTLTGSPGERPVLLMIAGGALIAVGLYHYFWKQ